MHEETKKHFGFPCSCALVRTINYTQFIFNIPTWEWLGGILVSLYTWASMALWCKYLDSESEGLEF